MAHSLRDVLNKYKSSMFEQALEPTLPSPGALEPLEPALEAPEPLEPAVEALEPLEPAMEALEPLEPAMDTLEPLEPATEALELSQPAVEALNPFATVFESKCEKIEEEKVFNMGLLKIDFKNAFNLMDRNTFVEASARMFPGLERWTRWCYTQAPLLIYDHSSVFESCCGVQQGDPLGPLYFCCGLQSIIDKITTLNPTFQKWYMDDGGIVGFPELLMEVWKILKTEGPPLGLILNPTKCEWSWLDPKCTEPCPIDQVAFVPTSEIQMLGVPLGSDEFVAKIVEGKLMGNTVDVMAKLAAFEDPQVAMYLLRISYGIVRANHFMRTTPFTMERGSSEV